jgi:hypothetical protein
MMTARKVCARLQDSETMVIFTNVPSGTSALIGKAARRLAIQAAAEAPTRLDARLVTSADSGYAFIQITPQRRAQKKRLARFVTRWRGAS